MSARRIRLVTGALLLGLNCPVGYGGLFVFSFLAIRTNQRIFYLMGLICYAASWGMVGLGGILVGSESVRYTRNLFRRSRRQKSWHPVRMQKEG